VGGEGDEKREATLDGYVTKKKGPKLTRGILGKGEERKGKAQATNTRSGDKKKVEGIGCSD